MEEKLKDEQNICLEQLPSETKIDIEDTFIKSLRTQPVLYNPNQPPSQNYYYQDPRYNQNQSPPYQQRVGGQNVYVAGNYPPPPQDVSRGQYAYVRNDQQNNDDYGVNEIFNNEFTTVEIRNKFVQKVYTILAMQIFFTFLFVLLVTFTMSLRLLLIKYYLVVCIVAMVIYLTTSLALTCCVNLRRTFPLNFILLGLLTVALTFIVCAMSAISAPIVVLAAVGTTAGVCLLVSIFACQTKWDITGCGLILCLSTLVLLIYGLIIIILTLCGIHIPILHIIYSGLGCFLFCLWLMYDTQVIVGGRRVEISPEEYIFGALTLYVDIMMIFMFLMDLFRCCLGDG